LMLLSSDGETPHANRPADHVFRRFGRWPVATLSVADGKGGVVLRCFMPLLPRRPSHCPRPKRLSRELPAIARGDGCNHGPDRCRKHQAIAARGETFALTGGRSDVYQRPSDGAPRCAVLTFPTPIAEARMPSINGLLASVYSLFVSRIARSRFKL
jgi:hypothetical protein